MELLGIHEGGHRQREYELANENARRTSFGSGSRAKHAPGGRPSWDAEDGDADRLCGIADVICAADPNFYLHFTEKKTRKGKGVIIITFESITESIILQTAERNRTIW